jgi:hypothetical protein
MSNFELKWHVEQLERARQHLVAVQQILQNWNRYFDWLDHSPPDSVSPPEKIDFSGFDLGAIDPANPDDPLGGRVILWWPDGGWRIFNSTHARSEVPLYLRDTLKDLRAYISRLSNLVDHEKSKPAISQYPQVGAGGVANLPVTTGTGGLNPGGGTTNTPSSDVDPTPGNDGSVGGGVRTGGGSSSSSTSGGGREVLFYEEDDAGLESIVHMWLNKNGKWDYDMSWVEPVRFDPEGSSNSPGSATSGSPIRPHGTGPASDAGDSVNGAAISMFVPELAAPHSVMNLPDGSDFGPSALSDSLRIHGPGIASLDPDGGNPDSGESYARGFKDPRGPAGRPNPDGGVPVGPATRSWLAW